MVVRSRAAPPTPWSNMAEPKIHETAYVHSFANIVGDVQIEADVKVAPGTSIRAEQGNPFYIGAGTNLQDGVMVHGLEQGRVVGDDQNQYSVWIGKNVSITPLALIHGPAYVGDDCFIGFRSTLFNARLGKGCIVMMHALIQDVEIAPGKYVPSGSVITNQHQADHLPDVQQRDRSFADHVAGINDVLRAGDRIARDGADIDLHKNEQNKSDTGNRSNGSKGSSNMASTSLSAETVEQLRYLLGQGFKIGVEHVDERRFRTGSWQSCGSIEARNQSEAIAAVEAAKAEYSNEYVRLIGIDPKAKRRVVETIIQRPNGNNVSQPAKATQQYFTSYSSSDQGGKSKGGSLLSRETLDTLRSLIAQGLKVGTEHVDERRFRTNSWQSCSPIPISSEKEAIAALEACVANHEGEYVRLLGIDPKGRRRVMETIIQRPNQQNPSQPSNGNGSQPSRSQSFKGRSSTRLSPEVVDSLRQLLAAGNRISAEHVDERRFRTGSWQSCGQIQTTNESEAIAALESYSAEYEGEYVRLIGIDPKAKRRVLELMIQRPNQSALSR